MKYSGIGGQAVLEGIMMRNGDRYAVAVRKPDGTIAVQEEAAGGCKWKIAKWPFFRGVFAFIDSLSIGMKALSYSSDISEEVSGESKDAEKEAKKNQLIMTLSMVIGVLLAVGIFMVLPAVLVNFLKTWIASETLLALIEGVFRLLLFILYVSLISLMKDIRRTYMYHGSEHKCINCLEQGLPLTVENVMKSSKEHRRCGTSFLLIVMLISIILFIFVRVDTIYLKILTRIAFIPVVAGISFEILRFTGTHDNKFVYIISRPGMWLQALTTKEPTPDMCEVAIAAVEHVFDWKAYLKENFGYDVQGTEE